MSEKEEGPLLSTEEVAKELGLSVKGVLKYSRERKLAFIRFGNKNKYRRSAVDRFIAEREVRAKK